MTEPKWEYGVEWRERDGRTFVGGSWTQQGAEAMVRDPDGIYPVPVRVMRREPGPWLPVPLQPEAAK